MPSKPKPVEGEVVEEAPTTALTPAPDAGLLVPGIATDHPAVKRLMKRLRRKTPKAAIKSRPGPMTAGGRMRFNYIPWPYVAQTLNEVFGPTWGREVLSIEERKLPDRPPRHDRDCGGKKGQCKAGHKPRPAYQYVAHVRITTPWANQDAIGAHMWFPDNSEVGPGDAQQSAVSKGMVRAAADLGIGLDLKMDLPDEFDMEADFATQDAQTAWKAALARYGLSVTGAVVLLSKKLTDDPKALTTVEDCLDATGQEGAAAYWALIDKLGESK